MRTATKTYVKIEPGEIEYEGKRELVEFLVTNWTVRDHDSTAHRDTKVGTDLKDVAKIDNIKHFVGSRHYFQAAVHVLCDLLLLAHLHAGHACLRHILHRHCRFQ